MSNNKYEAKWAETELADWIVDNLEQIRAGGAEFRGKRITLDTELIRYELCYSMVILYVRQVSPYLIAGSHEAKKVLALVNTITILFGWWSLYGIIDTPDVLLRNLRKRNKLTIRKLFELHGVYP